MTTFFEFAAAYDAWLADCLAEYNARYNESRRYFVRPDNYPGDYCPSQLVEFSDEGDAYPHGIGGMGHICCAVTPWRESPHYVD